MLFLATAYFMNKTLLGTWQVMLHNRETQAEFHPETTEKLVISQSGVYFSYATCKVVYMQYVPPAPA